MAVKSKTIGIVIRICIRSSYG